MKRESFFRRARRGAAPGTHIIAALFVACSGCAPEAREAEENIGVAEARAATPLDLQYGYTRYLGQLTGTPLNDSAGLAVNGTDLGISYRIDDSTLGFLFGDTGGPNLAYDAGWLDDSVATAPAVMPADAVPDVDWIASSGHFAPLQSVSPARVFGGMETPSDAHRCANGDTLVVMPHDWRCGYIGEPSADDDCSVCPGHPLCDFRHHKAYIGLFSGSDVSSMRVVRDAESDKFLNVSIVPVKAKPIFGGTVLYLFGTGPRFHSDVYLAKILESDICAGGLPPASAWKYLSGVDAGGAPMWTEGDETSASRLFAQAGDPHITEASVRRDPISGEYFLTYQGVSGGRGGVFFYHATAPWGPWLGPIQIDNESNPDAAGDRVITHFAHQRINDFDPSTTWLNPDDGLSEIGRPFDHGAEYGPYQIPQWYTYDAEARTHTIFYTLSSWNPYQVHVMQTVLYEAGAARPVMAPRGGSTPMTIRNRMFSNGLAHWTVSGSGAESPSTYVDSNNKRWLYLGNWSGTVSQSVTPDVTADTLVVTVRGDHGVVKLVRQRDGLVVRRTEPPAAYGGTDLGPNNYFGRNHWLGIDAQHCGSDHECLVLWGGGHCIHDGLQDYCGDPSPAQEMRAVWQLALLRGDDYDLVIEKPTVDGTLEVHNFQVTTVP